MKNRYRYVVAQCLLLMSLAALPFGAHAGNEDGPISRQAAAAVLGELDSPDKPAMAIALLQNGKVIYQQAFGSANLEHKAPATVDTTFQVDTLAWEFIAVATLMLEAQGKIKLDDDIRMYLPDLPDFGKTITINHLLSSTDGLYGYKVLKALAGWEPPQSGQDKAIVQLIKNQKTLNFAPGTAFSPGGDTRLILLAHIVEAASGQAFDAYCSTHIFTPLGMVNTAFAYDNATLPANTALPYRADGKGGFTLDQGGARVPGPLNLYSSIKDLALWRSRSGSPAAGAKSLMARLDAPIRLDRGDIIKDISSISIYRQQHAGRERGIPKVYQMGTAGGYASSVFHFPEQNITAIALSSGLAYNGSYAMRLAALLLKNHFLEPETIDYDKIASVALSPAQLQKFAGRYWSPSRAISTRIHLKNGVLYYSRVEGADGRVLIPLGDAVFQLKIEGDDRYLVKFVDKQGGKELHFSMAGSDPVVFEPYQAASYTAGELAQFAGTFYSSELNSSFLVEANGGILSASNMRVGTVTFKPITTDLFAGDKTFMGGIQFKRGSNNDITGFHIMVDEVRQLEFRKIRVDEQRTLPARVASGG